MCVCIYIYIYIYTSVVNIVMKCIVLFNNHIMLIIECSVSCGYVTCCTIVSVQGLFLPPAARNGLCSHG